MSSEIENTPATSAESISVHMESINRIAHLPAVEQTVQVATNVYCKVKDCSSVANWTLSTAECTVHKAVEIGKPIVSHFGGPIKKVDGMLCTGLDYVEEKIPAVKLPAGEMYTTTKEYVSNKIQPAVQTAKNIVEPAVGVAYHVVEPAVNTVRGIAEPYVQPAVNTACALKDYGCQKMNELLHYHPENQGHQECQYCAQRAQSLHSE